MQNPLRTLSRVLVLALLLTGVAACAADPEPVHRLAYHVGGAGK